MSELTNLRKGDVLICVNTDTPDWWEFECQCDEGHEDDCDGSCNEYDAPWDGEEYIVTCDWNRDEDGCMIQVRRSGRHSSQEFDYSHFDLVFRKGSPYLANDGETAWY